MILDLTRKVTDNALLVRGGGWGLAGPLESLHVLRDMTVGVVGFGRIGREVVSRLTPFRCKILVFDPAIDRAAVEAAGCVFASLEELLQVSDLVTLHCPSNDKTKYMMNTQTLGRMKKGAMLVNTSRGTLVKTDDLIAALRSGHLSAAALDVTDPEPIEADSPLRTMSNVLINSHIASGSPAAGNKLRSCVAGTVAMAVRGESLPNVVNGVNRQAVV